MSRTSRDSSLGASPRRHHLLTFLLGFALLAVGGLFLLPTPEAETAPSEPEGAGDAFVVAGVRVFDGGKTWPRADVHVAGGRVVAIGEKLDVPEEVERIDGAGKTLLPGLIDAHVHAWATARADAVRFGVTTLLDQFTRPAELVEAKRDRESGVEVAAARDRADLFSAGILATVPGGHGTQFGVQVPAVAGPDSAAPWVRERKAEGSQWIKIVVEHGWGEGLPTLDLETVAALIDAAHAEDMLAVVHVSSLDDALAVAELGADGLVHVWRDRLATPAELERLEASGVFVVATLVVAEGMDDPSPSMAMADGAFEERLSPAQLSSLEQRFPPAASLDMSVPIKSVRQLHEAGVTVLAGSDAPNPATAMGFSLHRELALLVKSGLEPAEALVAATSAPARAFRLPGQTRGVIEAGALADLVLVAGDPTADIAATRDIERVWKAGREVGLDAPPAAAQGEQAVAPAPEGTVLADFEDGLSSRFGAGWGETTDRRMGGESTAVLEVHGGVLVVTGELAAGAMFPWSGAMAFLGPVPMQAVDFSSRSELVFRARGEKGRRYSAMLFSGDMQGIPPTRNFDADGTWQTLSFELSSFHGADPGTLRAVAFTTGQPLGEYRLELDDVEIR